MAKGKKEKLLLKEPVYPGGQKAMLLFIQNNLQYPSEAATAKVEGTVRIRFSIDHTGKVFRSQILVSLGHGCDEEAIRLVGLLKFDVSKAYKLKVQYHKILNIHFKMQADQSTMAPPPPSVPLSIQYTLSNNSRSSESTSDSTPTTQGYHYTIIIMPD